MAHIVITGANRGIGLALAKHYAKRGDKVTALCRKNSADLDQTGATVIETIDVGDDKSVATLNEKITKPIDMLINNAGILISDQLSSLNLENMRSQFEVNTLGPLKVTMTLMPKLKSGAKVGIVSSRVGSIDDNSSGNNYGYRVSKTAVNMVGANLAHDLKAKGITVLILHPGYVKTDMVGGAGFTEPEDSAAGLVKIMDEKGLANTGSFWHAEGYELPW